MVMVLAQVINSFGKFLNESEVIEILKNMTDEFNNFVIDFLVKPMEDAGQDMFLLLNSMLKLQGQ